MTSGLIRCSSLHFAAPLPPPFPTTMLLIVTFPHNQLQHIYTEAIMYSVCSQGIVQAFVTGEQNSSFREG